jgi:hypothetical protein
LVQLPVLSTCLLTHTERTANTPTTTATAKIALIVQRRERGAGAAELTRAMRVHHFMQTIGAAVHCAAIANGDSAAKAWGRLLDIHGPQATRVPRIAPRRQSRDHGLR